MEHFLESLSNQELLARLQTLVERNRAVEAELLTHLGEVDSRRLYLEEGCSSMFLYCVRVLHFSEAAAYRRIRAARAARRHPEILEALRRGDLHVTAVSLLASQLTGANCREWIQLAKHKTADEIRHLLADRQPKPLVADCVRRVMSAPISAPTEWALLITAPAQPENSATPAPVPTKPEISTSVSTLMSAKTEIPTALLAPVCTENLSVISPPSPAPLSRSEPLGGERYRVCFTADEAMHAQLKELRALLRHQIPDGDLGKILGRAVALLLSRLLTKSV